MTSITRIIAVFFLVILSGFTGCKKDDKCTAGTGGDLTFVIYPQHHGAPIWNYENYPDTVMIKFNTQEFPGANPSFYDLVIAGDSGENHVHVSGMLCGDYYIYATGWDTSLAAPDTIVRGGIPFSIEATTGEIDIYVPVVE